MSVEIEQDVCLAHAQPQAMSALILGIGLPFNECHQLYRFEDRRSSICRFGLVDGAVGVPLAKTLDDKSARLSATRVGLHNLFTGLEEAQLFHVGKMVPRRCRGRPLGPLGLGECAVSEIRPRTPVIVLVQLVAVVLHLIL